MPVLRKTDKRRRAFDSFAAHYDRARPGYPALVADDIGRACGLTSTSRILEIGPGTGQATRLFARKGMQLTALEPSPALAQLARKNLAAFPTVVIVEQAFEEAYIPNGEIDLIYAAQSFHWVDTPAGFRKTHDLLHEQGTLALFWNLKRPLELPIQRAFDELYRHHYQGEPWFCMNEECLERSRREREEKIKASGFFTVNAVRDYPWSHRYTSKEYLALVDSYVDHRLLPRKQKQRLYQGLAAAIEAAGGNLTVPYTTVLFLCAPTARSARELFPDTEAL
jgi:SAM-dependent methyltransferase